MIRLHYFPLFLLTLLQIVWGRPAGATGDPPEEVTQFLATRVVLASVAFSPDSSSLSAEAKKYLFTRVPEIRTAHRGKLILRLEGFNGRADSSADTELAMFRAKAVGDYLRLQHGIDVKVYLTGFDRDHTDPLLDQARVDVVSYKDIMRFKSAAVVESVTATP